MADQGRWFKLWVSAISDPDLRGLTLEDFGRWCAFGAYLKLHGQEGRLSVRSPAIPLQELLRLPSFEAIVKTLESFPNCTVLVTPHVTDAFVTLKVSWANWQKYQVDNSAERTKKWRERKRPVTVGGDDDVTVIEEKRSRRDEKRRDETRVKPTATPLAADAAPTNPVWHSYCEAYRRRYGTDPVRNGKVNGALKNLLSRIPASEAPDVAAFYVGHNASFYVRAGHAVDLLVRDAEKLHTEWVTGRRITETSARAGDQRQDRGDIANKLIEKSQRQQGELDAQT